MKTCEGDEDICRCGPVFGERTLSSLIRSLCWAHICLVENIPEMVVRSYLFSFIVSRNCVILHLIIQVSSDQKAETDPVNWNARNQACTWPSRWQTLLEGYGVLKSQEGTVFCQPAYQSEDRPNSSVMYGLLSVKLELKVLKKSRHCIQQLDLVRMGP